MDRINQIVGILSKMESHTPFATMKAKKRISIKIQNYSLLGCIFSFLLLVILFVICLTFKIEKNSVKTFATNTTCDKSYFWDCMFINTCNQWYEIYLQHA